MNSEERASERAKWHYVGQERPPWAKLPASGEESVWDYPRPPRIEPVPERLQVELGRVRIAESTHGLRVLETAGPPVYYFPQSDVRRELLREETATSSCEWKGQASYFGLEVDDRRVPHCAWCYPEPEPEFSQLRGHFAFHAGLLDACYVGRERAVSQPGGYYGGWITSGIVGPFKGEPGSADW